MWLFGNKVMKSVEILENDRLCGIDEKWLWYTGKWPDEHTNINIHTSMHTHIYIYSSYTQSLSLPLFIYLQSSLTHTHTTSPIQMIVKGWSLVLNQQHKFVAVILSCTLFIQILIAQCLYSCSRLQHVTVFTLSTTLIIIHLFALATGEIVILH